MGDSRRSGYVTSHLGKLSLAVDPCVGVRTGDGCSYRYERKRRGLRSADETKTAGIPKQERLNNSH